MHTALNDPNVFEALKNKPYFINAAASKVKDMLKEFENCKAMKELSETQKEALELMEMTTKNYRLAGILGKPINEITGSAMGPTKGLLQVQLPRLSGEKMD